MLLEEARGLLDGGRFHLAGKRLDEQRVGEDGSRGLARRRAGGWVSLVVVVEEELVVWRRRGGELRKAQHGRENGSIHGVSESGGC